MLLSQSRVCRKSPTRTIYPFEHARRATRNKYADQNVVLAADRSRQFMSNCWDAMWAQQDADKLSQPFFGAMGCTSAIVFTCFGAAYGTAKAGVGISAMGVLRPDLIVKSMQHSHAMSKHLTSEHVC